MPSPCGQPSVGNTGIYRAGCARRLSELTEQIRQAVSLQDVNRLSSIYLWGNVSNASANRIIDEQQTPAAIVGQLNALEALAKARGQAMGTGFSYPVTVEAVARWTSELEARGLQLAPASAMTQRPGR